VWDIIVKERIHGFEHRAPVKREKKAVATVITVEKSKCMINPNKILQIQNENSENEDDDCINELHNTEQVTRPTERSSSVGSDNDTKIIKIRSLSLDETKLK
jgi:hypothetical protein